MIHVNTSQTVGHVDPPPAMGKPSGKGGKGGGKGDGKGDGKGRGKGGKGGKGGRGAGRGRGRGRGDEGGGGMVLPAKKRARSIERLLKRDTLPEAVRKQKEAELAEVMKEAQKGKRVEREKLNSRKYHGVKFFERRKIERKIEALKKRLGGAEPAAASTSAVSTAVATNAAAAAADDDVVPDGADLAAMLREAEYDLLYVTHFPRNKKCGRPPPLPHTRNPAHPPPLRANCRLSIFFVTAAIRSAPLHCMRFWVTPNSAKANHSSHSPPFLHLTHCPLQSAHAAPPSLRDMLMFMCMYTI